MRGNDRNETDVERAPRRGQLGCELTHRRKRGRRRHGDRCALHSQRRAFAGNLLHAGC